MEKAEFAMVEECGICTHLLKTCSKLGDKSYCKKLLDKLENNEISETEFNKKIDKKFGKKKFNKAWRD